MGGDPESSHGSRLSLLLEGLYAAAMQEATWPQFLEGATASFDAKAAFLGFYAPRQDLATVHLSTTQDRYVRDFNDSAARTSPHVAECRRRDLMGGAVWTGTEIYPDGEFVRGPYFRNFLAPQGLHHALVVMAPLRHGRSTGIGLYRAEGARDFTREDLALGWLFVRHLARALEAMRRLEVTRFLAGRASQLDWAGCGVLLLDRQGEVVTTNRVADEILARADGVRLDGRRLVSSWPALQKHLGTALRRALQPRDGSMHEEVVSIPRQPPKDPIKVIASPVPPDASAPLTGDSCAAVVFLVDRETPIVVDEHLLRLTHGLTPTEVRVAAALVRAERLADVARGLGMSLHTARAHLRRIFEKTGTHRQADLVSVLLRGPSRSS